MTLQSSSVRSCEKAMATKKRGPAMQATGAQEREIRRVKRDPDKQSELWATCPCDCLQEMSLQKKRGPECAFRVFGSAELDYPSKEKKGDASRCRRRIAKKIE